MTYPQCAMAAVQATATRTGDYDEMVNSDFDDRVGAGIVNLTRMLNFSELTIQMVGNSNGVNGTTVFEVTKYLRQDFPLRISLAWYAYAIAADYQKTGVTNGTKYVMNYNVYVYDSAGSLVASSTATDSSTELIWYTPHRTGNYRIVVKQVGNRLYSAPIAVAYYYSETI
ncbi:MAG: hypothetical protein E7616_07220 [Ruminococcaceae bacterium]|nr:hypothetical protein [Oscillospiraceae bacterium]